MEMEIKDFFEKLSEFNVEFKMIDGWYVVLINFPSKWEIIESENENIKHSVSNDKRHVYLGEINKVDIGEIYQLLVETIKLNKENALKVQLFQEKIKELQQLFGEETLDRLKTIHFTFGNVEKELKKRGRKPKMKIEDVKETQVNNDFVNMENKMTQEELTIEENKEITQNLLEELKA